MSPFNLKGMDNWDLAYSYISVLFKLSENKNVFKGTDLRYLYALKRNIENEIQIRSKDAELIYMITDLKQFSEEYRKHCLEMRYGI